MIGMFLVFSGNTFSHVKNDTASERESIHTMWISGITEASSTLSFGRNIYFIPSSRARMIAGSAPYIGLTLPSSASSPRKRLFCVNDSLNSISFQSIPRAIGRS